MSEKRNGQLLLFAKLYPVSKFISSDFLVRTNLLNTDILAVFDGFAETPCFVEDTRTHPRQKVLLHEQL